MSSKNDRCFSLLFAFMRSTASHLPKEIQEKELTNICAIFFLIGAMDYIRISEDLSYTYFIDFSEQVLKEFGVPSDISPKERLEIFKGYARDCKFFQMVLDEGSAALEDFITHGDSDAPGRLAKCLRLVEKQIDKFDDMLEDLSRNTGNRF